MMHRIIIDKTTKVLDWGEDLKFMKKPAQILFLGLGIFSFFVALSSSADTSSSKKKYKTFEIMKNGRGEIYFRSLRNGEIKGPYKNITQIEEVASPDGYEISYINEDGVLVGVKFEAKYNGENNSYIIRDKNGEIQQTRDANGNISQTAEGLGLFSDDAYPLDLGKHLEKSEWQKILNKKPEKLEAGCTEEIWRKGYKQGLSGQRFAIEISLDMGSLPKEDQVTHAPNRGDRSACTDYKNNPKKSHELKCCVQGFMEALPALAKAMTRYKNQFESKYDPAFRRCLDDAQFGASDAKKYCEAEARRSCPDFRKPDQGLRYLGCYTLAFALVTGSQDCKKDLNLFKDYGAYTQAVMASASKHVKDHFGDTYEGECRTDEKSATLSK